MTPAPTQRILVVDDDASIRRTLNILLSKAGYEVIQASDGSEAVRLWRDRGGDLVITDLHMPEKDGIETIIELLSHTPGISPHEARQSHKILQVSDDDPNRPGD